MADKFIYAIHMGVLHTFSIHFGDVKTLILLKFDNTGRIFNGSACGNNCAKWILKIAEDKDITIALHNIMDFGDGPYTIKILNSGVTVHNRRERNRGKNQQKWFRSSSLVLSQRQTIDSRQNLLLDLTIELPYVKINEIKRALLPGSLIRHLSHIVRP